MISLPRRLLLLPALLAAAFSLPAEPAGAQQGKPPLEIREIIFTGNRMVEGATVRARVQSAEGDIFDPEQITRDVRSIYELGFFEDIKVEAEGFEGGLKITFVLREKPIIRAVTFEGNDKLSESDIRDKLEFAARTIYNPAAVTQAVQQIKNIYREKGFFEVNIDTKSEPVSEGEMNLVFVIDEGGKFQVSKVSFTGNEAYSDGKLRRVMQTKRWTLFSLLTGSGRLVDEVLQEDRQRILSFYQDNGYLEARVGNPQVSIREEARRLDIVIPVTEGEQYRLGTLSLSGDTLVPLEEIKKTAESREGQIFRRSTFTKDLFNINQRYTEQGYAYVKVDYSSQLNPESRVIDVTLLVDKGQQARIGRIVVTGNLATRDKVIRRNITFKEGDLFSSADLRKSRRKIMNLGFFETVDIIPRPREETVIDIDMELKEKLTGAFSMGFGYSSEDSLTGQVRLSETNLFGRGQSLELMAEYGSVRKNFSLSFGEPAIFDSRYSFGFKAFNFDREYDEYDRHSLGGRMTLGRSIGEFFRGFVSLKHETVDVTDIAEDASPIIREQEGEATTNSVQLSLVRDSRDNFFNPSRGNRTVLTGEYAGGFLGGDNYFTKYTAETTQYTPLWWKLVFMVRGRVGVIDGFDGREPPIYEKFYVGGINSVRGFEPRSIGPKDINGDPIGAYTELIFNSEVIVPIDPSQGLNLVFFFDAGNGWRKNQSIEFSDLRTGAGLGVRWLSPMGPFRLEWGWNLNPRDDEPNGDWAFAIGAFF
jgi:outer membrane protein insertion porin family